MIGKVRSRVVDLEDGRSTVASDDLGKLLDFYEVAEEERDTVLALAAEGRKRQRRRAYTDLLPGAFQRFADLEASAAEIHSYESGIVPGLLRSPAYVRAVIADGDGVWWDASEAEQEQRIAFRLQRQANILEVTAPSRLHFVITEEALRVSVGSPETMHEQLHHLIRLMDHRDNPTVQVLRSGTYGNPARGGGFTVFEFGDRGTPVGFSNVVFGQSAYYQDEPDTAIMLDGFARIRELALPPSESRRLVNEITEGN